MRKSEISFMVFRFSIEVINSRKVAVLHMEKDIGR